MAKYSMNEKTQEIQLWLRKSQQDLAVAQLLINQEHEYLSIAVYHCQQSLEKGLKGYLTYQDVPFQKTHDLTILNRLCVKFDARFEAVLNAAVILTPYATQFRYPSEQSEPTVAEAHAALILTSEALTFIQQVLSEKE
jgi:HEPN domain-containing protein